ncbi:hypothetical protein ACFX13_042217 [Malus domestica]|uniref:Uncharacterized protein n=1 Tax=Malus domestica TaxID=3750 RepID=A0A498JKZ8_MALDO|nr:hypothetical protein DVH24_024298 [Malus domestica]
MGAEKLNFADMQPFEPVLEGEENPPSRPPITKNLLTTMEAAASNPVPVFNDLQAEKAKEIMGLATTGSSKIFAGFVKKLGFENQSNVVAENNSQEIKAPQYRRPSTE